MCESAVWLSLSGFLKLFVTLTFQWATLATIMQHLPKINYHLVDKRQITTWLRWLEVTMDTTGATQQPTQQQPTQICRLVSVKRLQMIDFQFSRLLFKIIILGKLVKTRALF